MKTDKEYKEIVELAVKKALEGGWEFSRVDMLYIPKEVAEWALNTYHPRYPILIYDHDFAKALWGEDEQDWDGEGYTKPDWQHHLQQMVIAEDPLQYLGSNL